TERLGIYVSHAAANRAVLLKLGVPADVIEFFGTNATNTHEEVLALQHWVERNGVRSIIVPTEIFGTRRLRWMLHRVFGEQTAIRVPALVPEEFRSDNWWRHEGGLVSFQNEIMKYLYYRLKY